MIPHWFPKTILLALLFSMTGLSLYSPLAETRNKPVLETQQDKVGYIIGLTIGGNLKRQGVEVGGEAFSRGVEDAMSGAKPALTEVEIKQVMAAYDQELRQKRTHARQAQAEKHEKLAEKNKKEGQEFLTKNGKEKGIVTTASGLQYKVLTKGTGASPTIDSTVSAHYRGTLIDGTEFDSSYSRGNPSQFQAKGVIKGWTEALLLMKVGSKWMLYIPSELAYGEQARSAKIGPNSVLVFQIELKGIQ